MKHVLVTGISGFLGWNLCHFIPPGWHVHGLFHEHSLGFAQSSLTLHALDLKDFSAISALWALLQPDAVIHLAALAQPNYCQTHPEESYQLNVEVSVQLAQQCAQTQIPYVFASTDLVFDGGHAPYHETNAPSPLSLYGQHKALAEERILSLYPQATICRLPLMFGHSPPHVQNFFSSFLNSMRAGQALRVFVDEFRTPTSAERAVG